MTETEVERGHCNGCNGPAERIVGTDTWNHLIEFCGDALTTFEPGELASHEQTAVIDLRAKRKGTR